MYVGLEYLLYSNSNKIFTFPIKKKKHDIQTYSNLTKNQRARSSTD